MESILVMCRAAMSPPLIEPLIAPTVTETHGSNKTSINLRSHLIEAASSIRPWCLLAIIGRSDWGWEITFRLNGPRETFRNNHEWAPGEGFEIKKHELFVIYGLNSSLCRSSFHHDQVLQETIKNMIIVTSAMNRIPPDQIIEIFNRVTRCVFPFCFSYVSSSFPILF